MATRKISTSNKKASSAKKSSNKTSKPKPLPQNIKRKEVSIEQVDNGFIVSSHIDTKKDFITIKKIAKTEKEAKDIASKML